MNFFNTYEIKILHSLHDILQCDFLDFLMPLVTALGNYGIFWILLAVILLPFKRTRKIGLTMGIALILGLIVGNLTLKPLTARIRPYDFDPSIRLLIPPEHEFSFPSGHTLASFEGAAVIYIYHRKFGCAALILAVLIAFSRLYLMVHYPIDVIAGGILGSIFALIAVKLTNLIFKNNSSIS